MSDISVHRLNREWERLRLKYRIAGSPPGLDRLLLTSRRKQARLRDLRARLAIVQREVDALDVEVAGLDKTIRFFLSDVIRQIESEHGPSWSPVPMLGFRVWEMKNGQFHGYRVRWEHRTLSAVCAGGASNVDVPHTERECADPPCGIYAAKDVDRLISAHADIDSMAIGLVAMTGKVVEHEQGWRAERVTVLALTFARGGIVLATDDPEEIEILFQGIGLADEWHLAGDRAPSVKGRIEAAMAAYMKEQERNQTRWILESPNEL